jgi:hypothetical protein
MSLASKSLIIGSKSTTFYIKVRTRALAPGFGVASPMNGTALVIVEISAIPACYLRSGYLAEIKKLSDAGTSQRTTDAGVRK